MTGSAGRKTGLHHIACPPPPGAPTVVFIHGAGADHTVWGNQFAGLRGRFGVIALDLPGHGRSPRTADTSIPAFASAVAEFLDRAGVAEPVLVGHSMGGAVALLLALDRPARCRGLVLVGSGAKLGAAPRIIERLRGGDPAALREIIAQAYARDSPADLVELGIRMQGFQGSDVLLADLMACGRFDVRQRLGALREPLLVICGSDDRITFPAQSEWLAGSVRGSRLLLIPGAGHLVMIEKPGLVTEAILEFISSDLPRPRARARRVEEG